MRQTLNQLEYQAKMMLNGNSTVAHFLMASLIQTIHLMIMKHPQSESSKGHLYFAPGCWPAGKTYEDTVLAAVEEQYLQTFPVPVHCMEFLTISRSRTRQGIVETSNARLCTG